MREPIDERMGTEADDGHVFETVDEDPNQVGVRRQPRSYAGALAGVYGTAEEVAAYLRDERASWGM